MAPERLASANLPGGSKHIKQERSHPFTGCGHSVEKDNCMFPPSHISALITLTSGSDNVVQYEGYCSNCEYKGLIPRAIMAGAKKHIVASLPSGMEVKIEGKPKYGPSQLTLQFASKDKTSTDETNEWTKFPVTVTPQRQSNHPHMAEVVDNDFELFQNYFKYGVSEFFEEIESIPEFGFNI